MSYLILEAVCDDGSIGLDADPGIEYDNMKAGMP